MLDKEQAKLKIKELVYQFSSAYNLYGITKEEQKVIEESLE